VSEGLWAGLQPKPFTFSYISLFLKASPQTGFVHFFRLKIQGLFKDFPGLYFEISRTFLVRIYHKQRKMFAFKPVF